MKHSYIVDGKKYNFEQRIKGESNNSYCGSGAQVARFRAKEDYSTIIIKTNVEQHERKILKDLFDTKG